MTPLWPRKMQGRRTSEGRTVRSSWGGGPISDLAPLYAMRDPHPAEVLKLKAVWA